MAGTHKGTELAWFKAKRSVGSGACVEVAATSTGFAVRDSKDPRGPFLSYDADSWRQFVESAKNGRFDGL